MKHYLQKITQALEEGLGSDELKATFADWQANINEGEGSRERAEN